MDISLQDIEIKQFVFDELRVFLNFWLNQLGIWCLTETITEGGYVNETGVEPVQRREELDGDKRGRERRRERKEGERGRRERRERDSISAV